MRNWITQSFFDLAARIDIGHLIENAVLNEFISHVFLDTVYSYRNVKFWRKASGAEVDFVFEMNLGGMPSTIPVEIKFKKFSKPAISRSYRSFIDEYNPSRGLVVTRDFLARETFGNTDVLFVPAYCL